MAISQGSTIRIEPQPAQDPVDHRRIQAAIDVLAEQGGGTVQLASGIYVVDAPIRLRSHVTLAGDPNAPPVIRKGAAWRAQLVVDADYGEREIQVDNAEGARVGMAVSVHDDGSDDWLVSTAIVTRIEGRTLYLDRRLVHDYDCERGGVVSSASSLVEAIQAEDVALRHLVVDGGGGHDFLTGCRGGAVYLYETRNSWIESLEVRNFSGDGISWQITDGIAVADCRVHHCSRYGLHPGTGAWHTVVRDCECDYNGSDGLYLCWRVQGGLFEANRLHDNAGFGVSIGHKDRENQFTGTEIWGNARGGILFREEKESNGAHGTVFGRTVNRDNGGPDMSMRGTHHGVVIDGVDGPSTAEHDPENR